MDTLQSPSILSCSILNRRLVAFRLVVCCLLHSKLDPTTARQQSRLGYEWRPDAVGVAAFIQPCDRPGGRLAAAPLTRRVSPARACARTQTRVTFYLRILCHKHPHALCTPISPPHPRLLTRKHFDSTDLLLI